jgi:NTP pyrophosphatase (non-canonical NTP hydrolase)
MVDVLWNLMRLAELKQIDLEKAFIEKWDNVSVFRENIKNCE